MSEGDVLPNCRPAREGLIKSSTFHRHRPDGGMSASKLDPNTTWLLWVLEKSRDYDYNYEVAFVY